MKNSNHVPIFGYSRSDIQRAQQGGRLHRALPAAAAPIKPITESDRVLLGELGVEGLEAKELYGVLDRLRRGGAI